MEIRQCRRCRKIFQYYGNPACPDCIRKLDEQFDKVKNYLYDNSHATIQDLCEATGVDEVDLIAWMKEGRLIMSQDAPPLLSCEVCGAPIRSGRFCPQCMGNVRKTVENAAQSMAPKAPAQPEDDGKGMHTKGRHMH
jgi:predicted amidophosphoribosyltransferase